MNVTELRNVLSEADAYNPNVAVTVIWPGDWTVGIPTGMWGVESVRVDAGDAMLTATVDGELTVGWLLSALNGFRGETEVVIAIPDSQILDADEYVDVKTAYVEADGPLDYGDPIPDPILYIVIQD